MFAKLKRLVMGRGRNAPDLTQFIEGMERLTAYTPDYWKLSQYEWQNIFVPDELMEDQIYNHMLGKEAELRGVAYTNEEFCFWQKRLGQDSFPIPLDKSFASPYKPVSWAEQKGAPAARIKGEVYTIRPIEFLRLDRYRENGVQFTRKRVSLSFPYREVEHRHWLESLSKTERHLNNPEDAVVALSTLKVQPVRAWMYIGRLPYWRDLIEEPNDIFTPVQVFHPKTNDKPYYHFTKHKFK